MTFKDEYKKDNQMITPDAEFLKQLSTKMQDEINNPQIKISKSKPVLKYCMLAACAAIIIGISIAVPSILNNSIESTNSTFDTAAGAMDKNALTFGTDETVAETTAGVVGNEFADKFVGNAAEEFKEEVAEGAVADEFDGAVPESADVEANEIVTTAASLETAIDEIIAGNANEESADESYDMEVDGADESCDVEDDSTDGYSDDILSDEFAEDTSGNEFDNDTLEGSEFSLETAKPIEECKTFGELIEAMPELQSLTVTGECYTSGGEYSEDVMSESKEISGKDVIDVFAQNNEAALTNSEAVSTSYSQVMIYTDYGTFSAYNSDLIVFYAPDGTVVRYTLTKETFDALYKLFE